jgi:arylsulfatase A-like enzyme
MPYRNSVFTGRYPHETRVTSNNPVDLDTKEFVNMGTYFRQAGYQTAYFGKWHLCFDKKDPASHGFETVGAEQKDGHDAGVAAAGAKYLSQAHDRPFLLVLSFLNPHNICEYARRMAGTPGQLLNCGEVGDPPPLDQLPPAPANWAIPESEPDTLTMIRKGYHADPKFPVGGFSEDMWRQHRWGYYRMIEKVDAEIGKALAALRQAGLEEDTLIVLSADHGDCAGAHHFNQKTVFYEESTRVPLIVSLKGKTKPGTSDKLVNTGIDILPTMLDFAGIAQPKKLPGLSLRPLALGQPVANWRDHVVIQNHMDQTGLVGEIRPSAEGRMIRTGRYKYCVYSRGNQRESLADLQNDPGELKDLATNPDYRKVLLEHRALLAKFGQELNDPLVAEILANNVQPLPFTAEAAAPAKLEKKKKPGKKAKRIAETSAQ